MLQPPSTLQKWATNPWLRRPLPAATGAHPQRCFTIRAQEQEDNRLQFERGNCYGCGVRLQTGDPQVAGFVERGNYDVKARRRQLGQLLCLRCQDLSNGAMIPAVADFPQQQAWAQQAQQVPDPQQQQAYWPQRNGFTGKALLTPEELREKLKVVQRQRALVVLLVDLLDASGSILGRVRDLVGNNPIVLVGTKADLLPAGADGAQVAAWLQGAAAHKRINAVSVHLVSSRTGAGVPAAVGAIRKERRGRDVFVVGAANVGKSAFIRALMKDMCRMGSRQFDPQALSRGRYLPVESAMPGTTLELIPMDVFEAGGQLFDTPGLHLHHRVPHLLTPAENKQLHPRRRLRPYVPPSPVQLLQATAAACSMPPHLGDTPLADSRAGCASVKAASPSCLVPTYWWGGLAKLQLLSCPLGTELVFYGPQALLVEASVEAADLRNHQGNSSSGGDRATSYSRNTGVVSRNAGSPVRVEQEGALSGSDGKAEGSWMGLDVQGEEEAEGPHGFGAASVMNRGGLRPTKTLLIKCDGGGERRAIADIAVSGVPGWVAVHACGGNEHAVQVRVWTPPGVEVFNRPPLPVPSPLLEPANPDAGLPEGLAAATPGSIRQEPVAVSVGEYWEHQ